MHFFPAQQILVATHAVINGPAVGVTTIPRFPAEVGSLQANGHQRLFVWLQQRRDGGASTVFRCLEHVVADRGDVAGRKIPVIDLQYLEVEEFDVQFLRFSFAKETVQLFQNFEVLRRERVAHRRECLAPIANRATHLLLHSFHVLLAQSLCASSSMFDHLGGPQRWWLFSLLFETLHINDVRGPCPSPKNHRIRAFSNGDLAEQLLRFGAHNDGRLFLRIFVQLPGGILVAVEREVQPKVDPAAGANMHSESVPKL